MNYPHARRSRRMLGLVATLGLLVAAPSFAATTNLLPTRDGTLYENPAGLTANGAGTRLFTGVTLGNSPRRAVLAFNVPGSIPAGATITGVTLTLNMEMTIAGASNVDAHRVLADWGEGASVGFSGQGAGGPAEAGDATWLHTFFDNGFWANAGGDFAIAPSASASVGGNGDYTWGSTPELVADVQDMLDNPAGNFGWILLGDEATAPTAKAYGSRESGNPPVLSVTFDFDAPVPTVSEWGLILMTLMLLSAATIVFGTRRVLVGGGAGGLHGVRLGGSSVPFHPARFAAALGGVALLTLAGYALALTVAGELSRVDLVGGLLAAPLLAYLIHLWSLPSRG